MYWGAFTLAASAVALIGVLYLVNRTLAPAPDAVQTLPYQSGWAPEEHALSRYHVRWYLATIVFLAFDVEMLFMYPWAVVVAELGAKAVVEMFAFLGALLLAVMWAWREGAFRWV